MALYASSSSDSSSSESMMPDDSNTVGAQPPVSNVKKRKQKEKSESTSRTFLDDLADEIQIMNKEIKKPESGVSEKNQIAKKSKDKGKDSKKSSKTKKLHTESESKSKSESWKSTKSESNPHSNTYDSESDSESGESIIMDSVNQDLDSSDTKSIFNSLASDTKSDLISAIKSQQDLNTKTDSSKKPETITADNKQSKTTSSKSGTKKLNDNVKELDKLKGTNRGNDATVNDQIKQLKSKYSNLGTSRSSLMGSNDDLDSDERGNNIDSDISKQAQKIVSQFDYEYGAHGIGGPGGGNTSKQSKADAAQQSQYIKIGIAIIGCIVIILCGTLCYCKMSSGGMSRYSGNRGRNGKYGKGKGKGKGKKGKKGKGKNNNSSGSTQSGGSGGGKGGKKGKGKNPTASRLERDRKVAQDFSLKHPEVFVNGQEVCKSEIPEMLSADARILFDKFAAKAIERCANNYVFYYVKENDSMASGMGKRKGSFKVLNVKVFLNEEKNRWEQSSQQFFKELQKRQLDKKLASNPAAAGLARENEQALAESEGMSGNKKLALAAGGVVAGGTALGLLAASGETQLLEEMFMNTQLDGLEIGGAGGQQALDAAANALGDNEAIHTTMADNISDAAALKADSTIGSSAAESGMTGLSASSSSMASTESSNFISSSGESSISSSMAHEDDVALAVGGQAPPGSTLGKKALPVR